MNTKPIAILTIQRVKNYGAALQAFALQKKMDSLGYTSEIIDFQRENCKLQKLNVKYLYLILPFYKTFLSLNRIRHYLTDVLAFKDFSLDKKKKQAQLFRTFEDKFLRISKTYKQSELNCLNDQYPTFIVGSDQVWNHTFQFDIKSFFLYNRKNELYIN